MFVVLAASFFGQIAAESQEDFMKNNETNAFIPRTCGDASYKKSGSTWYVEAYCCRAGQRGTGKRNSKECTGKDSSNRKINQTGHKTGLDLKEVINAREKNKNIINDDGNLKVND